MPIGNNVHYRYKTYPSGRRVRLAFIGDRVVETKSMPKTKLTKTKRRLNRKLKRIGI